jgi:two-component system sensor histidine kinase UhpB
MFFRIGSIPQLLVLCTLFAQLSTKGAFAQPKVDSLLRILKTSAEDSNKVIVYRMLTGIVANTAPAEAIDYGKKGVELGKKLGYEKGVAGCYLNLSFAYGAASNIDQGIRFVDSAIVWSKKAAEPARISLAYLNRGDFQMQLRNLNQALADCDTALHYAELSNNDDRRARIFQTIGSVYFVQKNYSDSRRYYTQASELYDQIGNKKMSAIICNNLGNVDKRTGDYLNAINQFNKAISQAREANDKINVSMYHGNLSDAYLLSGMPEKAAIHANIALEHARAQDNQVQMAVTHNYLAQISLYRKRYMDAIESASKAFKITGENSLMDAQHTAAEILAEAHSELGQHKEAYYYLDRSKTLHDSLTKQKYDEEIATLETAFKIKDKNKEIELLNKNKELQEQRIVRQRILLIGICSLAILVGMGILLLLSRRRIQQQLAEMELRNSIAADLHDDVGSSLSSICMLSEMAVSGLASSSKEELLSKVSAYSRETMGKMGDIVWMIKPAADEGFDLLERMERFLHEMCTSKGIIGQFDSEELRIPKLSMHKRKALYLIFKEAVNNAVKYAAATTISVRIRNNTGTIQMKISDDGTGFDLNTVRRGNGIANLQNRAKEVGGTTTLVSSLGEGTTITCLIPS